jgi:DNA-binding IclR family transcriptional regulator
MDKTLLKGLAVLEAVTGMDGEARSIEAVAQRVGLTRSNTHRTLQTLIHAGYIEKDPLQGGFRGTMKMFELGTSALNRLDVRKFAPSYMTQLAEKTGETVHLSVLDGFDVIYIDKIDSAHPVRAYTTVGGRAPAYAVATGKALLAVQSAAYLDQFIHRLVRFTPSTIVKLPALKVELAKALRVGYAINRGEWRDSVGGLAAAIFDALDRPVAALGISGPLERLSVGRMKELAPMVVDVTMQLSKAMGYSKGSRRIGVSRSTSQ